MPGANWFALIGAVGRDESSIFVVGEGTSVKIGTSGTLNFFANDLPLFYFNNSGAINLEITREN